MIDRKFQIFGSENSTDYDVMVFVDEILDVESSHILCKEYDTKLAETLNDKPLNSNLAVVKDGLIKGAEFARMLYEKVQENIVKLAASWDLICSLIQYPRSDGG